MTGTVLVSVVIGADGVPGQIELVRGAGFGLDEKAAEAVSKWRFKPATKDGAPVRVKAQIEVNFRLL
jgi:TonB family protein